MDSISKILKIEGLKNTPQRYYILKSIFEINGHPTVDEITREVRKTNPQIGVGTIYNVIDVFVGKNILTKVKTDNDVMRFELTSNHHHHLYDSSEDRIEDYLDIELDEILKDYFRKKKIPGFKIEEVKLQIIGDFINK